MDSSNLLKVASVKSCVELVHELPEINKGLLIYLLDLTSMIALRSSVNKMTAEKLAALFQPVILSHPNLRTDHNEIAANRMIVVFLIECLPRIINFDPDAEDEPVQTPATSDAGSVFSDNESAATQLGDTGLVEPQAERRKSLAAVLRTKTQRKWSIKTLSAFRRRTVDGSGHS